MVLLVAAILAVFAGTGQAAIMYGSGATGTASGFSNLVGGPDGSYARFNYTDFADVTFSSNFVDGILPDAAVFIELTLLDAALLTNLDVYAHRTTGQLDALSGYGLYEIGSLLASGYQYDFLRLQYNGGSLSLDVDAVAVNSAPVPEPGTMMLLGSGLVGMAIWGRKKFRK
jgi:hypothetical protein